MAVAQPAVRDVAVLVQLQPLGQRIANAHLNASCDLPLESQGVERSAHVMHRGIAKDLHLPGC